MTLPVTDKASMASSGTPSTAANERFEAMGPDRPETPTGVKITYLALLKSIDYEAILAHYQAVRGGAKEGDVALSNQVARIFEEARTRTVVASETFARYAPGVGYFTTSNADDAEALASEMIRVAASQNTAIPIVDLHKNFLAVIVTSPMAEDGFAPAHELIEKAEALARVTAPGEVRVSDAVYQSMSAERRGKYEPVTSAESPAAARPAGVTWRRRAVLADELPSTVQRAVMVVDMARFSRIQANMKLMYKDNGASTLSNQITGIIGGGFESAGAASYEQYMHKWGGDGGIFFFDDPALAHRVAVEILKQAEERQNREARENNCDDAMRCFRIGIDFGRLDRAPDRKEYAGEAITRATRLESGGPSGEVRVTEEFYTRLSLDLKRAYGGKQPIFGKDHDQPKGIPGRRLKVADRAPWTEVGRDNKPFGTIEPNGDFPDRADLPGLEQCFVICPLGDDHPRVADVFDRLIGPACARVGFTARRATDLPGDRKTVIAEQLWNSALVIAYLGDPAEWNLNVILEVGIRLATGLPLIIMSDALEDGAEPDYQQLLPFQIVHQNVITVPRVPEQKTQKLIDEIGNSRSLASQAWESPHPVMEFRYRTFDEVIITDANETARAVFGADNIRKGQTVERFRNYLLSHCDPAQAAARTEEQMALLDALLAHAIRGRTAAKGWRPPRARIPIVLKEAEVDPLTGKPVGYLPIVLRYHFDQQFTRVRYLYLRVSAAMKKDETAAYYVCDI